MRLTLLAAVLATAATCLDLQTFHTEDFAVPAFNITVNKNPSPGYLFYGTLGKGNADDAPLIYTSDGQLVWWGNLNKVHNFRKQQLNGDDVISYWTGFGDSFGHGYGSIDIFDKTYKQLHSVCLKENIVVPDPSKDIGPCFFDGHESYLTDRNTVVATAFNTTRHDLTALKGPENGWIFDAQFYEVNIDTNEVVFSWKALDHIDITDSNYRGKDPDHPLHIGKNHFGHKRNNPWDFFHINSVQPVEGGYIVNSRMTWSFYFVNGQTGNVEWTLEGSQGGDFTLDEGIFWSWQHMPRLISITRRRMIISLFANNNINLLSFLGKNASDGYLLEVDLRSKRVKALKDLVDADDPVQSSAEGSYQALDNGNALLGYGAAPVIKEFDGATNEVTYSVDFASRKIKGGGDNDNGNAYHSYRAYRYSWDGFPTTSPKAAGIAGSDGTVTAYMSWNGATTVDAWNVYAGSSIGALQLVASAVSKDGFETGKVIGTSGDNIEFVQVEALSSGSSLGKSTVVQVQSAGGERRKSTAQSHSKHGKSKSR